MAPVTLTMALSRSVSQSSDGVSLVSSRLSTECGTTSGSSTSTVPGPGALTGKALKALGTATLRGLARIVMAKHLATVTHNFPHTDEQASRIRHIDDIYDDLLEFSRPGMYSPETCGRAMGFILTQIGMGHTRFLIKALSRWHSIEMHLLLSRILIELAPLWNPSLGLVFSSPLYHSYSTAQPWRHLSPIRLILFLSRIIRINEWTCRVVLDVGFLDVLLSVCHSYGFSSPNITKSDPSRKDTSQPYNSRDLLIACNAALLDVTAYPEHRSLVATHPIAYMWPTHRIKPTLSPPSFVRKTVMLDPYTDVPFDEDSAYLSLSLADVCAQPSVSNISSEMLWTSLISGITHDQAMRTFLVRSPRSRKVAILSPLVNYMSKSLFDAEKNVLINDDHFRRHELSFSLRFITEVAKIDTENRLFLLGTGIVDYLVHVLRTEMPDSYFSFIAARGDATDVSKIIRECGLQGLLDSRGTPISQIHRLIFAAFEALFKEAP